MTFEQPSNALLIATRWDELSPPPGPKRRTELLAAQQRALGTEVPENVYCKMHGEEISVRRCLASQFDPKCLGCSAVSHLCHRCWLQPIAMAELELCAECLEFFLAEEKSRGQPQLDDERIVWCLVEKRKVKVFGCRRRQLRSAKSCFGCGQPARVCGCKEFPVCYPQDGYCRRCAVKTYGGDEYAPLIARAHAPGRYRELCGLHRARVSSRANPSLTNPLPVPAADAAADGRLTGIDALAWEAAMRMVMDFQEHGKANTGQIWLAKQGRIPIAEAHALQLRLEKLGVLGPSSGTTQPRRLLVRSLEELERVVRPKLKPSGVPGTPAVAPSDAALALRQIEELLGARPNGTLAPGQVGTQLQVICQYLEPLGFPTIVAVLQRASDGLNAFGQIIGQMDSWLKRTK
ncbi:MAG: hypothetical protein PHI63_00965 [Patescibacteria group bacterium]|nr:hypothetical protein [Patescibacteria group bacterium]